MAFDVALTKTTDVSKHERVLRLSNYPENELIAYFPEKIPDDSKNITFKYHLAILQGGEAHKLNFETTSTTIQNYINNFTKKAIWIGKLDEALATDYAIYSETFS